MRIIMMIVGVLVLNIVVLGQSTQTPTSKPKAQEQQSTDILYDNIPVKPLPLFPRPKITLQEALKLAEDYIKSEKINISPYHIDQVQLIRPNLEQGVTEQYWWFLWVKEGGAFGDYVEIGVRMDGTTWRMGSM